MTGLRAVCASLIWALAAVVFGPLPLWATLFLTHIDREVSFSETDMLKSGAIIIFAITLTISVLVDYHLSRFRLQSRSVAVILNVLFPFAICVFGMVIHLDTINTKDASLQTAFVLLANLSLGVFAVVLCVIQKIMLVYNEDRNPT